MNNWLSAQYANFRDSLEESMQDVYTGLNLMFKFDREAFEETIQYHSPEEKFIQSAYEEGFESTYEYLEYHDKQGGKSSASINPNIQNRKPKKRSN